MDIRYTVQEGIRDPMSADGYKWIDVAHFNIYERAKDAACTFAAGRVLAAKLAYWHTPTDPAGQEWEVWP